LKIECKAIPKSKPLLYFERFSAYIYAFDHKEVIKASAHVLYPKTIPSFDRYPLLTLIRNARNPQEMTHMFIPAISSVSGFKDLDGQQDNTPFKQPQIGCCEIDSIYIRTMTN